MSKQILIIFDGKTDSTVERMATAVASGARTAGVETICETVGNAEADDLLKYDGIIFGSPCYFAGPSARMKGFMDSTWSLRGKLVGKVGGAFVVSEHIAGGNEMTLTSLLDFMLIHGMVVQGDCNGDYFGPVAINPSGEAGDVMVDDSGECARLGTRVAELIKKLG